MNSLIPQSLHTCQLMANEFVEKDKNTRQKDKNRNLFVFSKIPYFMGYFVSIFIKKTKRQSKKVSRKMKKNVCVWRDITRLRLQPHSPKPLSFCLKYLKSISYGTVPVFLVCLFELHVFLNFFGIGGRT